MQLTGETLPDVQGLVAPFRPPPGLELLDYPAKPSAVPARRSWADVVKSKASSKASSKALGNHKGTLAPKTNDISEDTDEETRASSMTCSESDYSDEEPPEAGNSMQMLLREMQKQLSGGKLNADAPAFVPPSLNADAQVFVPKECVTISIEIDIPTSKLSCGLDVEARTPLRSNASMFVPSAPGSLPSARAELRTQAKAFVPQSMGQW